MYDSTMYDLMYDKWLTLPSLKAIFPNLEIG